MFNIGDVVQLKSGGIKMTVSFIMSQNAKGVKTNALKNQGMEEGDVLCVYSFNGQQIEQFFNPETLMLVQDE